MFWDINVYVPYRYSKLARTMKTATSLLYVLMLCALTCCISRQPIRPTWGDEFEGESLDTLVWQKISRGAPDWRRHMSDWGELYALRDGNIVLRAVSCPDSISDTMAFLTGGLYTLDKRAFADGRWEIRARFDAAQGFWPAIWLLPQTPHQRRWPHDGEIDIMEHLNHDSIVYQTIHSNYTVNLGIKDKPASGTIARINPDDYNIYAIDHFRDSVVFFVNGQRTFAYPRVTADSSLQFPFSDHPFYLILSAQLGGGWVGEVDPAQLPAELVVDWVRFYQH